MHLALAKKMKRSLNNKRNYITAQQIEDITKMYGDFKTTPQLKIYDNADFGCTRITIERPEVKNGKPITDKKGGSKADSSLRDAENVPLKEAIETYFKREVAPHVPDAWIDESKNKTGYEINFNREFYVFKPLRSLADIRKDILALEEKTHQTITQIIT